MSLLPGIRVAHHLEKTIRIKNLTLDFLKAVIKTVKRIGQGKDVSPDSIVDTDPKQIGWLRSYLKKEKHGGEGISPRTGQDFKGNLKGAKHIKFTNSGAVALCWFWFKGRPYFMIDNHEKPPYSRFANYYKETIKGRFVTQSGTSVSGKEMDRRLAALKKAGLL